MNLTNSCWIRSWLVYTIRWSLNDHIILFRIRKYSLAALGCNIALLHFGIYIFYVIFVQFISFKWEIKFWYDDIVNVGELMFYLLNFF